MKRPSFQFYPSDWLRDTALRTCSIGARGLWIDMICFMHEGNPYGHLKVADKVILPENLARMVGETLEVVEGWLGELNHAGVFQVDEHGAIFSKRMIRDENLRQIRAAGGSKGGNPALTRSSKVNLKVIQEVKQNPTPSSSSSSSSSKNVHTPVGVSDDVWKEFISHRKAKKAKVTQLVVDGIAKEAALAGWTLEDALKEAIVRGWTSFKSDWVEKRTAPVANVALQKIKEDDLKAAPIPANIREKINQLRGITYD